MSKWKAEATIELKTGWRNDDIKMNATRVDEPMCHFHTLLTSLDVTFLANIKDLG